MKINAYTIFGICGVFACTSYSPSHGESAVIVQVNSGGQSHSDTVQHPMPEVEPVEESTWTVFILPSGFTPVDSSKNGVVLLKKNDDGGYYKWFRGELVFLGISSITASVNGNYHYYKRTEFTAYLNNIGTIAGHYHDDISNNEFIRIDPYMEMDHDQTWEQIWTLTLWSADGSVSTYRPGVRTFSRIRPADAYEPGMGPADIIFKDSVIRPIVQMLDDSDANWSMSAADLEWLPSRYRRGAQTWIGSDPDTIIVAANRSGDVVMKRFNEYFVNGTPVTYAPYYISDSGAILASTPTDGPIIRYPDGTIRQRPLSGQVTWIDEQDRPAGILGGYPVVWAYDPGGWWIKVPMAGYIPMPAGWTTDHYVTIDCRSRQLGIARKNGVTAPFLAIPNQVRLGVDLNRDGAITHNQMDATSSEVPYRFWLNDDDDVDDNDPDDSENAPVVTADYTDDKIDGVRDLEDFGRMRIYLGELQEAVRQGQIRVGLKWKGAWGATGAAGIRVWRNRSPNGGTEYLTDVNVAQQHLALSGSGTIQGALSYIIPTQYWTDVGLSESQPYANLLFEGTSAGKDQLVITLHKADGAEIGEGPGVWFDLKNIKSMYQRVKVTPRDPSVIPPPFISGTTFDANGSGTEPSDDGYPFAASAEEAKTALVFVHGSNIPYEEARWNAETMLKRLWWQGYKGRFVLFYWDTLIGPWDGTIPAHYNLNEYRALKYGWALKNYVESALPSDYAHNVVGHSMGNAVITSALRARKAVNGSVIPGMAARNVVFMQAAMPASCFDSGAATLAELAALESPQTTPDGVGQMGYRGLVETGVNATLFNIYNENDYALGWWVTNQRLMKPEDLLYRGYARKYTWTTTGGGQLWDWSNIEAGPIRMRYLEDVSESMSFVARSRTAALGRMNVGGSISNNLNISEGTELNFGRDRPDHSGEFTRRIQQLGPFYRYLFERAR